MTQEQAHQSLAQELAGFSDVRLRRFANYQLALIHQHLELMIAANKERQRRGVTVDSMRLVQNAVETISGCDSAPEAFDFSSSDTDEHQR